MKLFIFREISEFALNNPDILSLSAGMPNPNMFPFQSAEFITSDGMKLSFKGSDMKQALQYTSSQGYDIYVITGIQKFKGDGKYK